MNIRATLVILGMIGAGLLVYLGFEWIYVGYGLNPWIAFPGAFAFYYYPHHLLIKEAEALGIQLEDLLEEIDARGESGDSL